MQEPNAEGQQRAVPNSAIEFKYKHFGFAFDEAKTCEPKQFQEWLCDQALAGWSPRQINEHLTDTHLHITAILVRLRERKIMPIMPTTDQPYRR